MEPLCENCGKIFSTHGRDGNCLMSFFGRGPLYWKPPAIYKKIDGPNSVLQDWVMTLGLRHQGVLLGAMRGCDLVPKKHVSKSIHRALRADCLNSHCGDPKKSASYIEVFNEEQFWDLSKEFTNDLDVYPLHYIMHLAHAAEVVGYKHPIEEINRRWRLLYFRIVTKLHLVRETESDMDLRLTADEETFKETYLDGDGETP